jgi:hypothetical protein
MKPIFVIGGAVVGLLVVRGFMFDTVEEIAWRLFWHEFFKGDVSALGMGEIVKSATFAKSVIGLVIGGVLGSIAASRLAMPSKTSSLADGTQNPPSQDSPSAPASRSIALSVTTPASRPNALQGGGASSEGFETSAPEIPEGYKFSADQAAQAIAVTRGTLQGYIRSGRINDNPDGTIDAAELLRAGFIIRNFPPRSA